MTNTRWIVHKTKFELIIRRCSAPIRTLPSVFILGATKCGSTSLANILWQHPCHVKPMAKELLYLQKLQGFTTYWEFSRSLAFLSGFEGGHSKFSINGYKKFFPLKLKINSVAMKNGYSFTSDCDPFNLYCPIALQRIQHFAKNPKFIISLRNPIDRAYSDYLMHYPVSHKSTPSFEESINNELNGKEIRFRKRFLNQSHYEPHILRWIKAFGRDRIFIIKSEDFFQNEAAVTNNMFKFLSLSNVDLFSNFDLSAKNKSVSQKPPLKKETKERLMEYFYERNKRIESLLGTNFNWNQDS